jgi:hypothetical protein
MEKEKLSNYVDYLIFKTKNEKNISAIQIKNAFRQLINNLDSEQEKKYDDVVNKHDVIISNILEIVYHGTNANITKL